MSLAAAREMHERPGAQLMYVGWEAAPRGRHTPAFSCSALRADCLCGIYETRPEHCRDYDCRDDEGRMWAEEEGDRPYCEWPRQDHPVKHYSMAEHRHRMKSKARRVLDREPYWPAPG